MKSKVCTSCSEEKQICEFSKRKDAKDGRRNQCRECGKRYRNERYRRKREEILREQKEYYWKNKEREDSRNREYYSKNKSRWKQYQKDNKEHLLNYRVKNKERIAEYQKKYWKTENGRQTIYRGYMKRRSYKQKVFFTPHDRKELLDRDSWTCQNCFITVHDRSKGNWNTPDKAHVDHIIPLSKGGDSAPYNLQILCRTCNATKHNKTDLAIDKSGQVELLV